MKNLFVSLGVVSFLMACTPTEKQSEIRSFSVDELAVAVTPQENREYSYTDKKAGFWYGRTHQDEPVDWYAGWNLAKKRIFSDYILSVDGKRLVRQEAEVTVLPDCLTRCWKNAKEQLQLVDNYELLCIRLSDIQGDSISFALNETLLKNPTKQIEALCYTPIEAEERVLKIVPLVAQRVTFDGNTMKVPKSAEGFLVTCGTEVHCDSLVTLFRNQGNELLAARKARMNSLIQVNNPLHTNLPELDKALAWITLTMDELITEQQGKGIYADLPWFNEYWGRDMFIAMPGATLVTGQFDYTKEILKDFAKLQDTDTTSVTCGRVPNRANLEGILYNTTDGTPRYVMEAEELLKYSGDQSFLKDIYPSVVLSIDQSIRHHIDEKGYLLHEDADTWMDVKRNGIPVRHVAIGRTTSNICGTVSWYRVFIWLN